tara:strand:- start:414 stop:881 length:468 start_codon:yes stop_codon:yes gene_type:complete
MNLKSKIKNAQNFWLYQGKAFELDMIPEGAIGFVYEMNTIIGGKKFIYIGKKNFYSMRKKKFGKKALAAMTDKRIKKYEIIKKPNYETYYSSNRILMHASMEGALIHRVILKICYSKTELTYQETKYQFKYEVLEKDEYLNGNILGKFYKQITEK